jgi:hypothetical protein
MNVCAPDDALVVRNIFSIQFVKPPSDTLLRYFNMFHLASSPSSLQFRTPSLSSKSLLNLCNVK